MRFDLHPDSQRPTGKRKPPNYFSTSVRLRLATLVVLLGLVLIAMNEAGKPATWERLGFHSAEPGLEDVTAAVRQTAESSESRQDASARRLARFWRETIRDLKDDECATLYAMVDAVQNAAPLADDVRSDADRIVSRIRHRYDQNESLAAGETERQHLEWTLDMLSQDSDTTNQSYDQSTAIERLMQLLDSRVYENVEDRTALNRTDERLAWQRSWHRLANSESDAFTDVSWLQLIGQPSAYRGSLIRVRGDVRGMELLNSGEDNDSKRYIVLWIKPTDSNQTPYCVYTRTVPDSFPEPEPHFKKMKEPVVVEGLFFKLRSYLATNQEIEICPLIMAESVQTRHVPTVDAAEAWTPPAWLLVLLFAAMPVAAAWLAIRVYQSTRTPIRYSGEDSQSEIANSLKVLARDPGVQSDRDKVQKLYERDQIND